MRIVEDRSIGGITLIHKSEYGVSIRLKILEDCYILDLTKEEALEYGGKLIALAKPKETGTSSAAA